ncbi:MAG: patatin-like phospholipase family protein [Bacteroidales bacterium]|nr:patatin-like phospholipase family protein [Bacteroidales bacterium]MBD5218500.1 patatin-like phospholipase family protein [Bacteroidales bacterium]MBD5222309.1 patatin-like phospholipase family protein [Bacteroidales bacterium]
MAWRIDGVLESIGLKASVRTGMALSGGGARGFVHVGVLMAFERFGIRPDIISGVSAGSIAAVLYAAGISPLQIIECFASNPKFGDFTDWALPKSSFLKMTKFEKLLDSWLPVSRLEELQIPTVICATDFDHGKSVGWSKGEIVPRVVASCSIPIIFPPVRINGTHYVDGGVLRNLPAWAIRKNCTVLYGSNCSPLSRNYSYKNSMLDIALRSYSLMAKSNIIQDLALCDYVIQAPEVAHYKTFDLSSIRKLVTLGYDTACKMLETVL